MAPGKGGVETKASSGDVRPAKKPTRKTKKKVAKKKLAKKKTAKRKAAKR